MATKKQKREAALAKRARFMEEQRQLGLAAQQAHRKRREEEAEEIRREVESINRRHLRILATHIIKAGSYK